MSSKKRWKRIDKEVAHPVYKNSVHSVNVKFSKEEMAEISKMCKKYNDTPAGVVKFIVLEFAAMTLLLGIPPIAGTPNSPRFPLPPGDWRLN